MIKKRKADFTGSSNDENIGRIDLLGHILFIVTAFNWFLVFMLMKINGATFVHEITPIREFEVGVTGIVSVLACYWFVKKTGALSLNKR